MKVLQKMLFTFAMVIGVTIAVSAQNDPKKPPPKDPPPVINPQPKNPPQKPPGTKPIKPSEGEAVWKQETGETA